MSHPICILTRNIVIKYHLLGLLIIINYLLMALQPQTAITILPVISLVGLFLITTEFIFPLTHRYWNKNHSTIKNQLSQFIFELGFYLCTGLVVALFEFYFFHYSVHIVAKSAAPIFGVGFYMSIGIAIEVEYERIRSHPPSAVPNKTQILPAGLKLRYFLLILLMADWLVFSLVYLQNVNAYLYFQMTMQSFQEIIFVSVVIVSLSIYLFYLFSRNFIYALGMQVNALRCMEEDNLDVSIPVVTDDELALLAVYHNTMLERLRERRHLYRTLEKSVGSNIMKKLLTTDEKTLKQGQVYSVAILFCDLRGFTSLGESASAEDVILFLNDYFADVSSVISEHHGIINKFMGDAVLAIFGLEKDGGNAVEDAVNASLSIIQHNTDFYMPNEMHPETGVGIDFGSVIGGTIGSEERYEYTIIGDAVNKASRLEGLTKRLNYSIILSEDAYQQLNNGMRQQFFDLGAHKVRGRQEAISVYGSSKKREA